MKYSDEQRIDKIIETWESVKKKSAIEILQKNHF